jgi:hypothetical protein
MIPRFCVVSLDTLEKLYPPWYGKPMRRFFRERAAQFVALAKQHPEIDDRRRRSYTKAAELEQKLQRGPA